MSGLSAKVGSRGGDATLSRRVAGASGGGGAVFGVPDLPDLPALTFIFGAGSSSLLTGWKNLRIPLGCPSGSSRSLGTGDRVEMEDNSEESSSISADVLGEASCQVGVLTLGGGRGGCFRDLGGLGGGS